MDFILLIGWIILGIIVFAIVNKAFNIMYFGFSGMVSVFVGCMAAVAVAFYFAASIIGWIISLIVGFITTYYKWIIGAIVLLVLLAIFGSKSEDKSVKAEHNAN
jgi:hypothetical protein